jgi:hypothetical protein
MASISAKATAKRLAKGGPTFIQRSRSASSEQKAIWHNVTGAGRSGVIREFFGLNQDDGTAIQNGLETLIKARLDHVQGAV